MTNFVQRAVSQGGELFPLVIPERLTSGTGLMNPSVFIDDDGDILVNLRHVNYTLYHSEKNQRFPSRWGPLAYLHPESDQALRTINYLVRLDNSFKVTNFTQIQMLELHTPIWEFTGLEDARIAKWDGDYYIIGVRRDTTTNGQGRMELSKIALDKDAWSATEVSRLRIPAPNEDSSYCEKNWVPILDRPYHFVKWTANPSEIVRTYPDNPPRCEQVALNPSFAPPADQRGGSPVVRWKDKYISITHEVALFNNYLKQKDGVYRHRLCVWDDDLNLIGMSPSNFSFLDGWIEFCAGAAVLDDTLLVSFGFQDNCAFILRVPEDLVDEMIADALTYGK